MTSRPSHTAHSSSTANQAIHSRKYSGCSGCRGGTGTPNTATNPHGGPINSASSHSVDHTAAASRLTEAHLPSTAVSPPLRRNPVHGPAPVGRPRAG